MVTNSAIGADNIAYSRMLSRTASAVLAFKPLHLRIPESAPHDGDGQGRGDSGGQEAQRDSHQPVLSLHRFTQFAPAKAPVQLQRFADDPNRVLRAKHVFHDDLLVFQHLVFLEELPHLAQDVVGELALVGEVGERGSRTLTATILSSMPFSSRMRITPIARASTIVSGWTGSWLRTSASSGSRRRNTCAG